MDEIMDADDDDGIGYNRKLINDDTAMVAGKDFRKKS